MALTILDCPRTLYIDAEKAAKNGVDLVMSVDRVRAIAERWRSDLEKIAYLESLIVRMGRS